MKLATTAWLYSIGVAVLGTLVAALVWSFGEWTAISWQLLFVLTLLNLFCTAAGFSGPFVGHVSLDRMAQVALLLIVDVKWAVLIGMISALFWPFVDVRSNPGNWQKKLSRALHTAGMVAILLAAGGLVYDGLHHVHPLSALTGEAAIAIVAMVAVIQLLNEIFMASYAQVMRGNWRSSVSLFASVLEVSAAPLGVFAALMYSTAPTPTLLLFIGLLLMLTLIVRRYGENHWALAERLNALESINRVGRAISTSLILDDLVELVYQQCRKLLDFSAFILVLYDEERGELDFRLHHNEDGRQPHKRKKLGEGAIGWIIEKNKAFLIRNWHKSDHEAKGRAVIVGRIPLSVIGVPVAYDGKVLGAISVQNLEENAFDEADLRLLTTLADQVAISVANARLFAELEEHQQQLEQRVELRTREIEKQKEELVALSDSLRDANEQKQRLLEALQAKTSELDRQTKEDSLTGLFNRRYMDERVQAEFRRADRYGHPLSIAIIDIDNFKEINDKFSHMQADDVLQTFSNMLRSLCRNSDIISRYGGDEFLLCFPETDREQAVTVCEKIRNAVAEHDWQSIGDGLEVTISVGVAGLLDTDPRQTLLAADAQLYEAKRRGRNQVCAA